MGYPLDIPGGIAQMGEHLPCKQGVASSNLAISIGHIMKQLCDLLLDNYTLNIFHIEKYEAI